jgi:hypothetical protein
VAGAAETIVRPISVDRPGGIRKAAAERAVTATGAPERARRSREAAAARR